LTGLLKVDSTVDVSDDNDHLVVIIQTSVYFCTLL